MSPSRRLFKVGRKSLKAFLKCLTLKDGPDRDGRKTQCLGPRRSRQRRYCVMEFQKIKQVSNVGAEVSLELVFETSVKSL